MAVPSLKVIFIYILGCCIVNYNVLLDPIHELRKISEFLKIGNKFEVKHLYFNATSGFYCPKIDEEPLCFTNKGYKSLTVSNCNGIAYIIYIYWFVSLKQYDRESLNTGNCWVGGV